MHSSLPGGLSTLSVGRTRDPRSVTASTCISHDPRSPDSLLRKMLCLALRTLETSPQLKMRAYRWEYLDFSYCCTSKHRFSQMIVILFDSHNHTCQRQSGWILGVNSTEACWDGVLPVWSLAHHCQKDRTCFCWIWFLFSVGSILFFEIPEHKTFAR